MLASKEKIKHPQEGDLLIFAKDANMPIFPGVLGASTTNFNTTAGDAAICLQVGDYSEAGFRYAILLHSSGNLIYFAYKRHLYDSNWQGVFVNG